MPIIGYFLGTGFADRIERYDHWVAFALLLVLGGKMFIESFKKRMQRARPPETTATS